MLTMDPFVAPTLDTSPLQAPALDFPDPLLDGPVSRRVAVLDFESNGALRKGVPLDPRPGLEYAEYDWGQGALARRRLSNDPAKRATEIYDRDALRSVSVFTLVYKVLELFEVKNSLGRRINWAFPGEQLMVVPRAGEWANAYYERATRSLQFFSFRRETGPNAGAWVHTADSPDIVAHETAHAVLDGIAPDLYDSLSPEALAIHEAVADLTAVFVTLDFERLPQLLIDKTGGDLRKPTPIGLIAEEFGDAMKRVGGASHLRSLYSETRLEQVEAEPHATSEVLSSALWDAMATEYERLAKLPPSAPPSDEEDAPGGLGTPAARVTRAAWVTRRVLLRALDYLPPGDCSFIDLGRAMVAADEAAYPDPKDAHWRAGLLAALLKRGIGLAPEDLRPLPRGDGESPFAHVELGDLVASDWFAYRFAEANRELFCLPKDVPFEVRPRLKTAKRHYRDGAGFQVSELIFKVTWWETEANTALSAVAKDRRIRRGSTVVVGCDAPGRPVQVRLTNDPAFAANKADGEVARDRRDQFLARLIATGVLAPADEAGQDEVRRMGLVPVTESGGVLRIRELGAMLHMLDPHHHDDGGAT
jgi:hypothetical protein